MVYTLVLEANAERIVSSSLTWRTSSYTHAHEGVGHANVADYSSGKSWVGRFDSCECAVV